MHALCNAAFSLQPQPVNMLRQSEPCQKESLRFSLTIPLYEVGQQTPQHMHISLLLSPGLHNRPEGIYFADVQDLPYQDDVLLHHESDAGSQC